MPLHQSVLPNRRQAIVFNSTSAPSQFTYMFGIAVELAQRKTLGPEVDIYYMTDNTRKELVESTPGLKFLDLGEYKEVQSDLSRIMSNARAPPRDFTKLAGISHGFWEEGEVIMNCIMRCHEHLKEIRPMLVVLDQFSRALDGAMALRIPYIMCGNETTPTSKPSNPSGIRAVLNVPSVASGFAGPMTWTQTFQNVYMLARYMGIMLRDPLIRAQAADRRKKLNNPNLPYATLDRSYGSDLEHGEIWAMPKSILHSHATYDKVFPVGPTFAAQFEEKVTSNLEPWMDEDSLVYINMGTLFQFKDEDIHVFASTLLDLTAPSPARAASLVTRDTHRYLWKLPSKPTARLLELYPTFLADTHGRVRLEKWIDYPHAVLQHRNTLAMIHHGGANSFCEAAWFGIPQIVLPQWADCYDTAAQLKVNGLGLCNTSSNAPEITTVEFADLITGLLAAPVDDYSGVFAEKPYTFFKQNAERFAEECREAGGAEKAAEIVEKFYALELSEWDGKSA